MFSLVNLATSKDHISLTIVILADMKNLNDGPVNTNLKETEENEQLQIERDPEPDVDPKPAGEVNLSKD